MAATRRPIALAAAITTVAALGATAFTLPALAAAPAAAPVMDLSDGTLNWGLKESFRRYVALAAAGTISATDGATQAAGNGAFTFSNGTGSYDPSTHNVTTDFDGAVRFSSTAHGFDIKVSDVKFVTEGTGGAIEADVTLNGATQDDIKLASIDLAGIRPETAGGTMVFKDVPTTLTADGAKAFNGMYAEGTELDKATLAVKYSTPSTPTPTPTPTEEAPTPTPTPTETTPTDEPTTQPPTQPAPTPSESAPESEEPPAESDGTIVDGNLNWGVKESFRTYVTGPIAQGKVELGGGAEESGASYRFPDATGSFDADSGDLSASFAGTVRFLGHEEQGEYVLDLSLSDLQVTVEDGKGTLVADVSSKDRETHKVTTYKDLTLATLKLPAGELEAKDGVVSLDAVAASLTADGTKAFGGMYAAGTGLDKLTLAVSLDKDATLPGDGGDGTDGGTDGGSGATGGTGGSVGGTTGGTGGGSLASTGSEVPTGALLGAAGVIVAAGAAAVYVARRRAAGLDSGLDSGLEETA
ncbi:HtaA domain-containing protein [Streptomyces sp. NPDC051569]|uniref:HtaA domain-containing protein n=1 Tax=Streptomyces sp. NPDC051569 TaxID=3365661 RepID=UPI0037986640